jgi:hypothetical protein
MECPATPPRLGQWAGQNPNPKPDLEFHPSLAHKPTWANYSKQRTQIGGKKRPKTDRASLFLDSGMELAISFSPKKVKLVNVHTTT